MRTYLLLLVLPAMVACSDDGGGGSVPAAPSNLAASKLGTGIHLTWTDNSSDEEEFTIMRKVGTGAYAELTSVTFNTTTFHDDPVTAGTLYTYHVMAMNAAGTSGASNEVMLTP